jgi:long-chain acyl-CoA synthetase
MNLSMTLAQVAKRLPNAPGITSDAGTLTYGAFEDRVGRIAASLFGRHGLKPGAHVGIAMENCAELLLAMYGIWRAGLVAVPLNAKLHAKEMAFILMNAECKLCFCTEKIADGLTALGRSEGPLPPLVVAGTIDFAALLKPDPVRSVWSPPDSDAWLFYTSGTTGKPKGAVLTHRNLLFMCLAYNTDVDQLDERDTAVHAAALTHAAGLNGLAKIARGAHQVIYPGFEPEQIFQAIARYPNVSMFAAPTMLTRLLDHPRAGTADTRNLRTITFGGAPMYVSDLKEALGAFGPKLFQIYGQGESPCTITHIPKHLYADPTRAADDGFLASVGFARTGVEVSVVDEDGCALPAGAIGEVITRSDCRMRGYWNNPEANARAIRDGWLWTGDLGSMDAAGSLTLKDRSKDMIISGGSNIYPREIEEVLLTHPGVLEAAVVSRPHADWGEEVVAFVVRRPDAPGAPVDDAALDALCLSNIARFKRPKAYRFVDGLPKNNYGKVLKTELRDVLGRE